MEEAVQTMAQVEEIAENIRIKVWSEILIRPWSDVETNKDLQRVNKRLNQKARERGWAVAVHEGFRKGNWDSLFADGLHPHEDQGVETFVQDILDTIWEQEN